MSYSINGIPASIAPATVWWKPIEVGMDHNGQPLYSRYWNCTLEFDACTPPQAAQWLNAVSSGSVSLTLPNRWSSASFVTYSPVYANITESPNYETVNMAPFSITLTRIVPQ